MARFNFEHPPEGQRLWVPPVRLVFGRDKKSRLERRRMAEEADATRDRLKREFYERLARRGGGLVA